MRRETFLEHASLLAGHTSMSRCEDQGSGGMSVMYMRLICYSKCLPRSRFHLMGGRYAGGAVAVRLAKSMCTQKVCMQRACT